MGKINVLSFEIANLIAAGEVVERPSSVMKELIENSIDSGADKIVAEIKHGGVSLIRVSDNGSGIERDDLPVALKRHATSKIRESADLMSIKTLGFRGEALAAISAVSSVTIITKTKNADTGYMLTSEAGQVTDITEVGAADGTTVAVENLFYNVPARKKFLKKDSTEAMNVAALIEKVAISRPDISIQFLIDGEERFMTSGDGSLENALYSIFGKAFSEKLVPVDGAANGISVHGFVGRSDNARKNRNAQNIFINGRYVKSMTAMAALEKAYTSFIAPGYFPVCALFIDINPELVDVNVHPAKLEVKFANEQDVFEAVYYTVKRALEKFEYRPDLVLSGVRGEPKPEPNFQTELSFGRREIERQADIDASALKNSVGGYSYPRDSYVSSGAGRGFGRESESRDGVMPPRESISLLEKFKKSDAGAFEMPAPISENKVETGASNQFNLPDYKYIGEAFDCYVMIEKDGELLIIDKHAAHERILFEDLRRAREADGRIASQTLLLPLVLELSSEDSSAITQFGGEIRETGFDFSLLPRAVEITAVPEAISVHDAERLFSEMISELSEGKTNPEISDSVRRTKALYQVACKAAIKGGRVYERELIDWLIKKVLELPDITVCPHGRPIAYKLSKNELDRKFDRIK